jgi:UrcA family protein
MKTSYFLIAAAVAAFGVHTSAGAAEPLQQAVSYHDLDLTRVEDAQALYSRIVGASREVCGRIAPWPIDAVALVKQCRQNAIARAVADVNAPTLTTYYAERNGGTSRIEAATAATAKIATR